MIKEIKLKLELLRRRTRSDSVARVNSLARSGLTYIDKLNRTGRDRFYRWFDSRTRKIERGAVDVFESIDSLAKNIEHRIVKYSDKTLEEDLEISRMIDEGGPPTPDHTSTQGEANEEFKKAS